MASLAPRTIASYANRVGPARARDAARNTWLLMTRGAAR
jgi:hypothetical protein